MPKKYVLVSIIRTKNYDRYICFWRANNQGYTEFSCSIGIYQELKDGYHNSERTKAVEIEALELLDSELDEGGIKYLNNTKNREILGL